MRKIGMLLCGAALGIAIGACSTVDRLVMTEFRPHAEGFTYKAAADAIYPEYSLGAETERLKWLNKFLTDNAICPSYQIVQRRPVLRIRGAIGDVYDIFYEGVCV